MDGTATIAIDAATSSIPTSTTSKYLYKPL